MQVISLFSGVGGFDLGFERAGMRIAAQVEFDERAAAVLARHYPETLRFKDVRDVGRSTLPSAELICGGFPCQDVSVAGKRKGLDGERSGLWFEFHRIINELAPRWCVIENVPGLLSSNGGRDFAAILGGLTGVVPSIPSGGWKNAGFARGYAHLYGVAWRVLDSQYFGVAQRRRRVFIVASLRDGRAAEVLFERESGEGHTHESRKARAELARDIAASLRNSGKGIGTRIDNETGLTVTGAFRRVRSDEHKETVIASTMTAMTARDYKGATDLIALGQEVVIPALSASGAGTERTGNERTEAQMLVVAKVDNTSSNGWGVLEDGTTNTLGGTTDVVAFEPRYYSARERMGGKPTNNVMLKASDHSSGDATPHVASPQHGVRRLTPTESERLQGFPDGWTAGQLDGARYRQLGNAVCVNVAEWIGKRIMEVEA